MNRYIDLIQQTFDFPTKEFTVENNQLYFNGVNLMEIIETYGTPLKLTYLPKISENIQQAKTYFGKAMQSHNYQGKYTYCYCTKSSHFSFVLDEALKNDILLLIFPWCGVCMPKVKFERIPTSFAMALSGRSISST